jgi:acetyl esterase/lipase
VNPNPITRQAVLYSVQGADAAQVQRDAAFPGADGEPLALDVYRPAESSVQSRLPVVVMVHGYPDPAFEKMLGCRFKDMQSIVSWGRLIAASGLAAIAYTAREPAADLRALLGWLRHHSTSLGIDHERSGIWACSGHAALALSMLMNDVPAHFRCAALLYGYTLDAEGNTSVADAAKTFYFVNGCAGKHIADLRRDVPIFIARAGHDQLPGLNQALDRFVADALTCNLPLTLANHATGPHAFDLFDDSATTREIVQQTLAFLQRHLG